MHTIANAGGYDELYPRYRGNYNYSLTERLSWSEEIKRDMAWTMERYKQQNVPDD